MFRTLPTKTTRTFRRDGGVTFDGIDLTATATALSRGLLRRGASEYNGDQPLTDQSDDDFNAGERYHWGGLLAQSLFFNVIENSFRSASDDQIRTLLAHKPFWHDYVASIHQFNMRRWNDGDDFLVNYVGHPMQGAVAGFIEIQNDPSSREQEISATRAYWMSRFKAFLWATAYSTHSEISPLGEAGIGNEGGWTYPLHCRTRCTEPGTYKKYTNNTGWVDFIITPTVGSLWSIAEDTLDRFVSDWVQGGNRSRILPKILRGGLNPSRTMANALRLKAPGIATSNIVPTWKTRTGSTFCRRTNRSRRRRFPQICPCVVFHCDAIWHDRPSLHGLHAKSGNRRGSRVCPGPMDCRQLCRQQTAGRYE